MFCNCPGRVFKAWTTDEFKCRPGMQDGHGNWEGGHLIEICCCDKNGPWQRMVERALHRHLVYKDIIQYWITCRVDRENFLLEYHTTNVQHFSISLFYFYYYQSRRRTRYVVLDSNWLEIRVQCPIEIQYRILLALDLSHGQEVTGR